MKIGIDARIISKRGVGRYISNLISNLLAIDKQNEYYIYTGKNTEATNIAAPNCRFIRLNTGNAFLYEQFFLARQAQKDKVDILHSTDNTMPYFSECKSLVTIHDVMFIRPIRQAILKPTIKQRIHDLYKKISVPVSARKADHIITVSEYSKQDIINKIKVPEEKITVIPEGVENKYKVVNDGQKIKGIKEKYGINRPYVLISAAADLRKNTQKAIEAFSMFNKKTGGKYQLVITSLGEKEIKTTNIREKIKELKLENDVIITYYVADDDMVYLYNAAFVFLFPSLWEGFGLQVLEAFACGLAVITSDKTSLKETAGKAAYFADPNSTDSIASALIEFDKNDKKRLELVSLGFKQAEKFSWKNTAQGTLKIYRRFSENGN